MTATHLSDDGLLAFVEGTVSHDERRRWMQHVDACRSCHDLLAAAAPAVGSAPNDDPPPSDGDDTVSGTAATVSDSEGGVPAAAEVVRGARVGRFTVLERIGVGATAEVHAAYDPKLDRKVALKILRSRSTVGDQRLLREAQALARLAHPNVVSVFDAGDHGERRFVAMEFVVGDTLRTWLETARPWPEVLRIFLAAGRGLAAAHAVGIVHRDVKPDNVLVGADGRPRVVDFGLARADLSDHVREAGEPFTDDSPLTQTGATVGTPVYMAPEHLRGEAATPRSDQFAFCVALWEGLYGVRPFTGRGSRREAIERGDPGDAPPNSRVPLALRRVLLRGLSAKAADRWSSMDELLARLEGVLPRRRGAILAGVLFGVAAAGAGGLALVHFRETRDLEPCSGAAAEIGAVWSAGARARMTTHLAQLGAYGAEETRRTADALDGYAARWRVSHRNACLASGRGELTAQIYQRNLACLDGSRSALASIVDALGRVPSERLPDAVAAAHALPDSERCHTHALASTVAPPPSPVATTVDALSNELEALRMLAIAGEVDAADSAAAIVARSEAVGYAPLIARAKLVEGLAWLARREASPAAELFERAASDALGAGDDVIFVEAFARALYVTAIGAPDELPAKVLASMPFAAAIATRLHEARVARMVQTLPLVDQIAARLGDAGAFARPLLFNNAGVWHNANGDRAAARRWFERALAEPLTRAGELELSHAYGNLGFVTESAAEAARLFQDERAQLERMLGPTHIRTFVTRYKAASVLANPQTALVELRAILTGFQRHDPRVAGEHVVAVAYHIGRLAEDLGDTIEARSAMALVHRPGSPLDLAARCYRDFLEERLAEATASCDVAVQRARELTWSHMYAADALIIASQVHRARDREDLAIARLETARAILEAKPTSSVVELSRTLARVQSLLAELVQPREPDRARELARAAAAWYRSAGGYDHRVARLDALAR